jgi:hypothetical protein
MRLKCKRFHMPIVDPLICCRDCDYGPRYMAGRCYMLEKIELICKSECDTIAILAEDRAMQECNPSADQSRR